MEYSIFGKEEINLNPVGKRKEKDIIKFNTENGYISNDEKTLTQPLPRDTTIYPNNNKDKEFSSDGVEEREEGNKYNRKKNLLKSMENATEKEKKYLKENLEIVKEEIDRDAIHSRFEILDL